MGKFYLDNKLVWFRHRAEKDHKKKLLDGGTLVAASDKVDALRFFCKDGTTPPKNLRISDHNQALLAVIGANGYIGHLDAESSVIMRRFLKKHPEFDEGCPAHIVDSEQWSGAYIVHVGIEPSRKK